MSADIIMEEFTDKIFIQFFLQL